MMPFNVMARVKNMTRETKLGLAVSCSFLALLGVVLVLKMTEQPEEGQGTEIAAAAPNEKPPETKPAAPGGEQRTMPPKEPGRLPANFDPNVKPTAGETTSPLPPAKEGPNNLTGDDTGSNLPPITPPGSDPAPPSQPLGDLSEFWGNVAKAARTNKSAPPTPASGTDLIPPLPIDDVPAVHPQAAPSGVWGTALLAARTKKLAPAVPTGDTGLLGHQTGKDDVPPLPIPGAPSAPPPLPDGPKVADDMNLPPIPGTKGAKPTGDGSPMTVATLGNAGNVTKGSKGGGTGMAPLPPSPPPMTEKHDPTTPLPELPSTTGTGSKGDTAPALPDKKNVLPPPPPPPDLPPADGTGRSGSAVTGTGLGKKNDTVPSIDVGAVGVGSTGSKPAKGNDLPPVKPHPAPAKEEEPIVVGSRTGTSVPPLSLSPAPAAVRSTKPDVVSYTEDSYVAANGDTFQSISKAKYGDAAFGRALYLFNRSHPLAGDDLLQSDTLRAKQTVYLPPAQVLKSRYGSVINDTAAPAVSGVTVGTTSQRVDVSTAGLRTYRVAAGGEKVYDIARNLLGNGDRWVEIQKLNPGWDWERPIPANVTLQVPADARSPR